MIPVCDDAEGLPSAVEGVLAQDYPGPLEVVLAIAPSRDASQRVAVDLAANDERIRVVANPAGSTSAGLNRAVACAVGDIVARIDAHSVPVPGYLRRAAELLEETGADNVGGIQQAAGHTAFERAVAAAMTSRFGVGDSRFHCGGPPGPVDTVYLGVFRRDALDRVGGFDETLVRNQDYELNWRLRASGGTVWFSPDLQVHYRPRRSWRGLARQYLEYGRWKREVLRRHPRSLRWRQAAPPATLLANLAGLAAGTLAGWHAALAVPLIYLAVVFAASAAVGRRLDRRAAAWLPVVFLTMHGAWGAGLLLGPPRGLGRGRGRAGPRRSTAPAR